MLRPFLGPRSSIIERLKQCCMFGSSSSERLFGVSAGRYRLEQCAIVNPNMPKSLQAFEPGTARAQKKPQHNIGP
eukprot:12905662-Alexandrium_andersonii.AAC.1